MPIAVGVVTADRGQPFAQGGVLDRLQYPGFGLLHFLEGQRRAGRKLLEDLDEDRMRGLDAAIERLAAVARVVGLAVGKGGADALQDGDRLERPRDGVGGAQRPGLHGGVVKRIRQHEQPRHLAIGIRLQFLAYCLHALGRAQVDVDHDTGKPRRRRGNVRGRHRADLAHGTQDIRKFAALIGAVGSQQQASLVRGLFGGSAHETSRSELARLAEFTMRNLAGNPFHWD